MKADDGLRDLIGENLNLKRGRMLLRIQAKTELRNFRSNTKHDIKYALAFLISLVTPLYATPPPPAPIKNVTEVPVP